MKLIKWIIGCFDDNILNGNGILREIHSIALEESYLRNDENGEGEQFSTKRKKETK